MAQYYYNFIATDSTLTLWAYDVWADKYLLVDGKTGGSPVCYISRMLHHLVFTERINGLQYHCIISNTCKS